MRLRRPTAGERKEGGKRRGCQGGTVCGSLGSGLLPKIVCLCVSACLFSLSMCSLSQCFTISDLVASAPDKASSRILGWVGKFRNWDPFKASSFGLILQLQIYLFRSDPQWKEKNGAQFFGPKTHFCAEFFHHTHYYVAALLGMNKLSISETFVL